MISYAYEPTMTLAHARPPGTEAEDRGVVVETTLTGTRLLSDPWLNKGSAFSEEERDLLGLRGLLPYHVATLEEQLERTYENFQQKENTLEQYIFLASLHDRNETLFYRLLQTHISEMTPIVYTPTVGQACQRYSHIFRRARGVYLAYPNRDRIPDILKAASAEVSVIVVTDGERILGLGDLGAGGMGIPIGKLVLYTLCAGIHPQKTLPVLLDVGTNNETLLKDPLYLGWRHERLERAAYDRFIDQFVSAVKTRWPRVVLQWEDFAKGNAWRLLQRYRDDMATFNDDIQGTAAVTLAGLLRATQAAGRTLRGERVVIAGAGSAATGVAGLVCRALRDDAGSESSTCRNIWLVDTRGLVHQGRHDLSEEKKPFAQPLDSLRAQGLDPARPWDLETVIRHVHPTILIGASGQAGMFTEPLVRWMAQSIDRPIIFPLSNPTSQSEATAEQLIRWTEGRALVATGSPFPPVVWKGRTMPIGQCNNAFVFPGVGLGLIASAATGVPNDLFLTAAQTLAAFDVRAPGFDASLFPNLEHVRHVSEKIAVAVGCEVVRRGLSHEAVTEEQIPSRVRSAMWAPVYPQLRPCAPSP